MSSGEDGDDVDDVVVVEEEAAVSWMGKPTKCRGWVEIVWTREW